MHKTHNGVCETVNCFYNLDGIGTKKCFDAFSRFSGHINDFLGEEKISKFFVPKFCFHVDKHENW